MEVPNLGTTPPVKVVKKIDFKKSWPYILGGLGTVIAGVMVAWLLSGTLLGGGTSGPKSTGVVQNANEAGILDETFKGDMATGVLEEGGLDNEGTHHLVREGGPSKTVYLTSSVIDLQSFVGKKVEVWGETLASKKTPWLMDVVKVKVTE